MKILTTFTYDYLNMFQDIFLPSLPEGSELIIQQHYKLGLGVEARALHGITVYGVKQFLEVFKDKLGTAYIQDYEQGLISLFNTIKEELPKHFNRINKTNQIWADLK